MVNTDGRPTIANRRQGGERKILVNRERYHEAVRVIHAVALSIECPDCGAKAGKHCKPEYGCDELWRAQEALEQGVTVEVAA